MQEFKNEELVNAVEDDLQSLQKKLRQILKLEILITIG